LLLFVPWRRRSLPRTRPWWLRDGVFLVSCLGKVNGFTFFFFPDTYTEKCTGRASHVYTSRSTGGSTVIAYRTPARSDWDPQSEPPSCLVGKTTSLPYAPEFVQLALLSKQRDSALMRRPGMRNYY
jgi:hypothetical protein